MPHKQGHRKDTPLPKQRTTKQGKAEGQAFIRKREKLASRQKITSKQASARIRERGEQTAQRSPEEVAQRSIDISSSEG